MTERRDVVSQLFDRLLTAAALGTAVVSALATLAQSLWVFELLTHFRLQYIAVQLPLLLAVLWRRRWPLAGLLVPFVAVNAAAVLPYWPREAEAIAAPNAVELMTANLYAGNDDYARFVDLVSREQPDVLLLLEYTPAWDAAMSAHTGSYPYKVTAERDGVFGIALFSRVPLRDARVFDLDGVPAVDAHLDLDPTLTTRFIGVHLRTPTSAGGAHARNAQLERVGARVREHDGPLIVTGDFNMTPYSPLLTDWLERNELLDARRGRGFGRSWPVFLPLLGIPIDHFLISADFLVAAHYYGPSFGSDHYPVVTRLSMRGE